jgi:hypothetical protein
MSDMKEQHTKQVQKSAKNVFEYETVCGLYGLEKTEHPSEMTLCIAFVYCHHPQRELVP